MSDYDTGVIVAASLSGGIFFVVCIMYAQWILKNQRSTVPSQGDVVDTTNKLGGASPDEPAPPPVVVLVDVPDDATTSAEPPSSPPPPLDATTEIDRFHPSRLPSSTIATD